LEHNDRKELRSKWLFIAFVPKDLLSGDRPNTSANESDEQQVYFRDAAFFVFGAPLIPREHRERVDIQSYPGNCHPKPDLHHTITIRNGSRSDSTSFSKNESRLAFYSARPINKALQQNRWSRIDSV
jgi:hypothetical protein